MTYSQLRFLKVPNKWRFKYSNVFFLLYLPMDIPSHIVVETAGISNTNDISKNNWVSYVTELKVADKLAAFSSVSCSTFLFATTPGLKWVTSFF